jgi:TPR repeat protein
MMDYEKNYNKSQLRKEELKYFNLAHDYLQRAAKLGVNSAYFYLGLINLEGEYLPVDYDKAMHNYIRGAAKNNAYCFFELSRLYQEGVEEID